VAPDHASLGHTEYVAHPLAPARANLVERLRERVRIRWPQLASVTVHFRGEFAYVTGHLPDGEARRLCRLRFTGHDSTWDFALRRDGSYQPWPLPSGVFTGTPEEAVDCACSFHFGRRPSRQGTRHFSDPRLWVAVVGTAAAMTALLVYFLYAGLSQAVAISNVVCAFAAIASLLVALIALRVSRGDARPRDPDARPYVLGSGDTQRYQHQFNRVTSPATKQSVLALAAASVLLTIPLCTFATDSLLRYSTSWPWWVAAVAAILGVSLTLFGSKADTNYAAILSFNMLWLFVYSAIIIEFRLSSSQGDIGRLATLSWVGTICNALFFLILVTGYIRDNRDSYSRLKLLFAGCLTLGMALTAITLMSNSNTLWDFVGWVFFSALLVSLALTRALGRKVLGARRITSS
jgi:hypothetical protein